MSTRNNKSSSVSGGEVGSGPAVNVLPDDLIENEEEDEEHQFVTSVDQDEHPLVDVDVVIQPRDKYGINTNNYNTNIICTSL